MENCLFCKIASGKIPSEKVYETETVLVFKDIHPQAPVHLLAIPKKHVPDVTAMEHESANLALDLLKAVNSAAKNTGIADSGFRVITNTGPDSGQEVFHLHFHVIGGKSLGPLIGS